MLNRVQMAVVSGVYGKGEGRGRKKKTGWGKERAFPASLKRCRAAV